MLTANEKYIIENLIEYYKKEGGTLTPDSLFKFRDTIRPVAYESHTIIDKSIAIGLIKYKFSDRTGWTVLTETGWNFTTFKEFEKNKSQGKEIYESTIEKLKVDLKNAKRQARFFYPLTALTLILGILNISNYSKTKQTDNSIKHLELRVDTTNRVVKDLIGRIGSVRVDTSTRVGSSTKKK